MIGSDNRFRARNKIAMLGAEYFLYDCYNVYNIVSGLTAAT